jgi:hypothetical protein
MLLDLLREDPTKPWYWEGNVLARVALWLRDDEWELRHIANTARRESGIDLECAREGRVLYIEGKGWPHHKTYWARAFTWAVEMRCADPQAKIGIALPAIKDAYWDLIRRVAPALEMYRIDIYMVDEDGEVWPEVQGAL